MGNSILASLLGRGGEYDVTIEGQTPSSDCQYLSQSAAEDKARALSCQNPIRRVFIERNGSRVATYFGGSEGMGI